MFPAQRSCSRWILPQSPDSPLSHRYFLVHSVMNQVQDNSCGMMAILHVLLNINDSTIVGPRISSYKDFFEGVTADLRGDSIANATDLVEINNDYEMHHPVILSDETTSKEVRLIHSSQSGKSLLRIRPLHESALSARFSLTVSIIRRWHAFRTCRSRFDRFSSLMNRELRHGSTVPSGSYFYTKGENPGDCDVGVMGEDHRRDDPTTMNVAVMIVHESFISQYKRHLDMEKKEITDLKKQLETCKEWNGK